MVTSRSCSLNVSVCDVCRHTCSILARWFSCTVYIIAFGFVERIYCLFWCSSQLILGKWYTCQVLLLIHKNCQKMYNERKFSLLQVDFMTTDMQTKPIVVSHVIFHLSLEKGVYFSGCVCFMELKAQATLLHSPK